MSDVKGSGVSEFQIINKEANHILSRLFEAASKDSTRPRLCGVSIINGVAMATDGYIMAFVEHDDFKDIDIFIDIQHKKLIKDAHHLKIQDGKIIVGDVEITCGEHNPSVFTIYKQFNDAREVNPSVVCTDDKPVVMQNTIILNPELLYRLYKAIGAKKGKGVRLVVKSVEQCVHVHYKGKLSGYIMPMRG